VAEKKHYFINAKHFNDFVRNLLYISDCYAPTIHNDKNILMQVTPENMDKINLFGFRTVEPFKSLFFKMTELVSKYFGADAMPMERPLTLIGMRGCDFESLEVLDRVFGEGDFNDPFYAKNRSSVLLIGADCTDCGATCFCTSVMGKPYPTKLFDLNFTPVKEGFVVELGSEKGQKVIDDNPGIFFEAYSAHLDAKEKTRNRTLSHLDDKNRKFHLHFKLSATHKASLTSDIWKTLTKDCVECSACNFICPTCSCFLLLEQAKEKDNERFKVWDACLKASYAKVAGGANPRGRLYERLQNRYHCKFDYSFDRLNRYTCVGCGRCIDGCAGNIDMRNIFVELEKRALYTAVLIE
jgi:sulfhydrogenase subunit beta (sulfur reductase)